MRTGRLLGLIVWALAVPSLAVAADARQSEPAKVADPRLPISAFYADPAIYGAAISPAGKSLAVIRKDGGASGVVVDDLSNHTTSVIFANQDKDAYFDWIRWKGEDRLILGLTYLKITRAGGRPDGDIISFRYGKLMFAMDRDGKNVVQLFKRDRSIGRITTSFGDFLDALRNDPDHILAQAPTGEGTPAVWKVDIRTGVAQRVELGDDHTLAWDTDRNGDVIARVRTRGRDMVIDGRAPGQAKWSEVTRIRPKDLKALADFQILDPAEKPGQLYVAVKPENAQQGAARAVRVYDFVTHTLGPPVWQGLRYDVANIVTDEGTNTLLGVCYWVDTYRCDFKNPDLQANFRALDTFFHGDRSLTPVSHSDDSRWWVFLVSGPTERASYYLYDWKAKTMANLGSLYPDLPPGRLGVMERFTYAARDGTEIPAYLTRPPGVAKGPLPLVVLPHGGPEARDNFDFDTWSQILATRGYLVLQPNFRGSGGYGVAFAEAGYGQWGAKMQDDITDGVKQLIATGQADPARICIFGASYGGYAALIGGALTPELYKCVVSWAGISDLSRLMRTERGGLFVGERSPAYDYDLKAIGDPDADKDRLAKASAVTYAAGYKLPVLLIHGANDTTVPLEQSQEMERALKAAGRDVRLLVVKGEDHSGWDADHEKAAIAEVVNFIAAHIPPAPLAPAKPADHAAVGAAPKP